MKPNASGVIEGPEAFRRFRYAMKDVLAVPRSVVKERKESAEFETARSQAEGQALRLGPRFKLLVASRFS